jgi:hypothetical protein
MTLQKVDSYRSVPPLFLCFLYYHPIPSLPFHSYRDFLSEAKRDYFSPNC